MPYVFVCISEHQRYGIIECCIMCVVCVCMCVCVHSYSVVDIVSSCIIRRACCMRDVFNHASRARTLTLTLRASRPLAQVMVALTAKKIYGRWKRQQVEIKIDEIV